MNIIDKGGPVLTRAKIVLIFRGSGWAGGTPSTDDAHNALAAILASPYMSQLVQYRGIRRAEIIETIIETTSITLVSQPNHHMHRTGWRFLASFPYHLPPVMLTVSLLNYLPKFD